MSLADMQTAPDHVPESSNRSWAPVLVGVAVVAVIAAVYGITAISDDGELSPTTSNARLALDDLPIGKAPETGYLQGLRLVEGSRRTELPLPAGQEPSGYVDLDGALVVAIDDENGEPVARVLPDQGDLSRSWELGYDGFHDVLAASADGTLGAFVDSDDIPHVVQDQGRQVVPLPRLRDVINVGGSSATHISGTDCARDDPTTCTLIAHGTGADGEMNDRIETWRVRPGTTPTDAKLGIQDVTDITQDGHVAGTAVITDDGDHSCGAVASPKRVVLWKVCQQRLTAFSPDGRHVLGTQDAADSFGDDEFTIYDALTGAPVLALRTRHDDVGIHQMRWEDNGHVLLVVGQGSRSATDDDLEDVRWAVIRLGLDGSREYAVAPVPATDPYKPGLVLPLQ